MNVGQICQRKVVTIGASDTLSAAAKLMRDKHIGYLVVVEPAVQAGELLPIGVLTDRDIVVSVVAKDGDPKTLLVGDVMTRKPTVALKQDCVGDAVQEMRRIGVRRLPIVGDYGNLHGLLSLDDILIDMANDLEGAAGAIREERIRDATRHP
ncbi:MAG: CBS domain-containing protein [Gammaproteobacteria bacterium]